MSQITKVILVFLLVLIFQTAALIPPKFQWKTLDYAWQDKEKAAAICSGKYIANNNMPTGLARWKDKLFITIPRWKKGIPSSLNYVYLNGSQQEPLHPYPNWEEACLTTEGGVSSNRTVVSTFRVHVDKCDRLWVVDNGVSDMSEDVQQIAPPAILVFDLNNDELLQKHVFDEDLLRDSSVLTSIVVEPVGKDCSCSTAYAYITDMGSNAIIVYDFNNDDAWRVENHYFHFDPHAGVYNVGGIDFYWSDGVSSAALSPPKKDGFVTRPYYNYMYQFQPAISFSSTYIETIADSIILLSRNLSNYCDLYLQPTSSTKQFKMSTQLLRNKDIPKEDIFNGVEIVGERGPKSQVTACDIDPKNNVLFYTQVCKNGLGCWNLDKPFTEENTPVIFSDCNLMEFPNDVKVDNEGNVWILSDRQSKFLYEAMDYNDVNFRVLTAPAATLIYDTNCAKKSFKFW